MRVGFLINTCEPFYRGGYERRAWTFARDLVRQGHEVSIFTSCAKDQVIEGVQFIRLAAPRIYFNARGVRDGSADVLFTLSVLKLLWKLRAAELDVLDVCATPFLHLPLAAFVAWWKKIPAFLTCHEALLGSLPEYVRERGNKGGVTSQLLLKLLRGIYSFGMRSIPKRIAVSERTATGLATEGFPAEVTIEMGLEREAFSPVPPDAQTGPVRFVYCGRLTPIKAVDQAVSALFSLRKEDLPFRFDIIGEGSESGHLQSMVQAASADGLVHFHGALNDESKRALLAKSEIFILSSPREGFSIATLEAIAQGCCAVVVSDLRHRNGVLDFIRDLQEGLCVEANPEAMQAGLRRLLFDPELRLRLRRTAWATAQRFEIKQQTKRLLACYAASVIKD